MSIVQHQQQQQQTTDAKKIVSEGEDLSDTANDIANFESDANKTATSSSHQDSEYDTASDSQSSDEADPIKEHGDALDSGGGGSGGDCNDIEDHKIGYSEKLASKGDLRSDDEDGDYDDDDDEEDDDLTDDEDDGSIILDLERQRGDGEEHDESKKVDDDEDRSNPQYIPKRGVFYEHDDRTADDPDANAAEGEEDVEENKPQTPVQKKPTKKTVDRWAHDFYDETAQAPKSRAELVNSYGYDIRNEDGPPKTRRKRRYNRGPTRYTRKWEDESAYAKQSQSLQRNPRPEEFPELGQRNDRRNRNSTAYHDREEKENKAQPVQQQLPQQLPQQSPPQVQPPQQYHNDENISSNRRYGSSNRSPNRRPQNDRHENVRGPSNHHDRGNSDSRRSGGGGGGGGDYDYDRRNNKNDKNDRSGNYRSGRNTLEFKNQNRNRNGGGGSNDYDGRGNSGNHSRNNSDIKSYGQSGNNQHQYSTGSGGGGGGVGGGGGGSTYNDPERVESVSFTNSKLQTSNATNNNRYSSNLDYSNQSQPSRPNKERERELDREYIVDRLDNQQHLPAQRPITGRQQQPQPQQATQTMQIAQLQRQQPHQNTLLTTNHAMPITSSVISNTLNQQQQQQQQQPLPPQSQQTQSLVGIMPQQPLPPPPNVDYLAANSVGVGSQVNKSHHEANRPKRYSSQRQRSGIDPHQQQQQQQLSINEIGMQMQLQDPTNVMLQIQQQQQQQQQQQGPPPQIGDDSKPSYPHPKVPATVVAQTPYPSNYYNPPEYAPNVQAVGAPAPVALNPSQYGQTAPTQPPPYMQTPNPASAAVVQQMLSFVSAHTPLQAAPVAVPPVVANAQVVPQAAPGQFPPYPTYPGVQNYNSASGITYYAPQTQPPPRPILSQRRPTNAIPILAPPDHSNKRNNNNNNNNGNNATTSAQGSGNCDEYAEDDGNGKMATQMENAENIDHILDNMFVQRAPHFPPTTGLAAAARKSSSPVPIDTEKSNLPGDINATSIASSPTIDIYAGQSTKIAAAGDNDISGGSDQQTGNTFTDIDISVAKLSINDEKISSQKLTVVHDTDSGESIENAPSDPNSVTINNTETVVGTSNASAMDEQMISIDDVTGISSDIANTIAEEIVEQATIAADVTDPIPVAVAVAAIDADLFIESKSDQIMSLAQVPTSENVVDPIQLIASDSTTSRDQ